MNSTEKLLKRLSAIGQSVAETGNAHALLGLGSVGKELDRLDEYSDLDFFVIAKNGFKQQFIESLTWLECESELVFSFQNTADGYKGLSKDGVYYEFAVFEFEELSHIEYSPGRIVWADNTITDEICYPAYNPKPNLPSDEWVEGEILTCIYVGLSRCLRGEVLSGWQFVQCHAFNMLVDYVQRKQQHSLVASKDKFSAHRRFEKMFPDLVRFLPSMVGGYEDVQQSALAIVVFMVNQFQVRNAMVDEIKRMCKDSSERA